jgi:UDPglucose--hexose-1-phosphate uridylyltransferase
MPEFRKDPIVNRWVIIAAERAARPQEFAAPAERRGGQACPFCEGNEDQTPPEVVAYRAAGVQVDRPGWRVRVVPNKFPALALDPGEHPSCGGWDQRVGWDQRSAVPPSDSLTSGLYQSAPGVGAHEVIIESPRHVVSTAQLTKEELRDTLCVYRQRLTELKQDPRLVHGIIIKNVGAAAGATIEHAHSQLMAIPRVPLLVAEELAGGLAFYRAHRRCAWCEMIRQELAAGGRVVLDAPGFLAFCPFASRVPFETWIVPKFHSSHYERIADTGVDDLSTMMKRVFGRIEAVLDQLAYNYVIHTAPFDTAALEHYHWHIEVIPSLTKAAGFEWGTGYHINPMPPEEAAQRLRGAEL